MLNKKILILDFFRANVLITTSLFLFGFLGILVTILIPLFLGKFYQLEMQTESARGKIFDDIFGHINTIGSYFFLFAILIVLKFIFNYFQSFLSGITAERFAKSIRERLFKKQLLTQLINFQKKAPGNYLLRYSGDLGAINNFITKGIIGFINDTLFLLLTLLIFFLINPQLSIIILIAFPIIFIVIFLLNQELKTYTLKRRNIRSKNLGFISSRLNAILTIKVFNREPIESEKFNKKSTQLYSNGVSYYKWFALIDSLLPFLLYSMLGVILFVAYNSQEHKGGDNTGGQILVFIMLTVNAIPVFKRILKVNIIWQTGSISFGKLLSILNTTEESKVKEPNIKFSSGSINFENVSLVLNNGNEILKNFSYAIPGYGIYSLEGSQGSGKSTILKLLLGLYEPTKGQILIDSKNISELSKHTLRKNVTMISNELTLLGKDVFESVSYSRKKEKRSEVTKMLISLGLFMEGGISLDTPIIEGGRNISTGQRKLLLIARALLTNKMIILLDEPFADLDVVFKNNVIQELNKIRQKRTIIIIDKEKTGSLVFDGVINLFKN